MNLDSSIGSLKGIGAKTQALFEKLGVYTIRDMLLAFPRDYHKFPDCQKINNVKAVLWGKAEKASGAP